jgi:CheY-like chemotaxis protein
MSLVLIIEDNERNLELVRDILQAKGYSTLEAGTAEEGLENSRTGNIEIRSLQQYHKTLG